MRGWQSTDGLLVLLHWGSALALLLSVLTGFRIAVDAAYARYTEYLMPVALEGNVYWLHYLAGIAVTSVAIGYAVYLVRARLAWRLKLSAGDARATLARGRSAWRARNTIIYYLLFALIGFMAVTGILLYLDVRPPFGASLLLQLHLAAAWTLIAAALLHVIAQYAFGATGAKGVFASLAGGFLWLLKMLRPSFASEARTGRASLQANWAAMAVALVVTLVAAGGLVAMDRSSKDRLVIERIAAGDLPVLDGRADDAVWAKVDTATVHTRNGANLRAGESTIEVQAVASADRVVFKFRWEDPTRSFKHLPLEKTATGWHLLHEQYDIEDEDIYYEDKFGVLLAHSAEIGGGGTTHLGTKPIADLPGGLSARGLHYTTDGSLADMWQWKAVRSQPVGFTDDNSFGPPATPKPDELAGTLRYKGGYVTDKGAATYKNNFGHQGPGGFQGPLKPTRLPKDLAATLAGLGPMSTDPNVSDARPWLMTEADSVPYSAELDAAIPVGTVIPGIIITPGTWSGDRADLPSGAEWVDGYWTLEIGRKLDTGSAADVALRPDEALYLWVSVFDHTQTRHSRHMRPIELVLEQQPAS